jgi:hypothetical protein
VGTVHADIGADLGFVPSADNPFCAEPHAPASLLASAANNGSRLPAA